MVEVAGAPPTAREVPLNGPKRVDRPIGLRLGRLSRTLLIPYANPADGVLVLAKDHTNLWKASRQTNDFSIGRVADGITNTITFTDQTVSRNHLQVTRGVDGFFYAQDQESTNGTFEQPIKEIHGAGSVGNGEWATSSLTEDPNIRILRPAVTAQVENIGGNTFLKIDNQQVPLTDGVPFTIGPTPDNSYPVISDQWSPNDQVTLLYFDGKLFCNSRDRYVTLTTQENAQAAPSPLNQVIENAQVVIDLQRQFADAQAGKAAAEAQISAKDAEIAQLKQTMQEREHTGVADAVRLTHAYLELNELRTKLKALQKQAPSTMGQLDTILDRLDPAVQRAILHNIRGAVNKELHPDKNKTADPEVLAHANSVIDDIFKKRGV